MSRNNLFTWILIYAVVATGYAVVVELGNSVTLECPLLGTYPVWTGPDTLNMPLTSSGGVVYEPSVQYVNQSGLMIDSVGVKHNGTYQCYNGTSTSTVHLMVTSFNVTFMFNVTSDLYVSENATVMCTVMGGFPTPDVSISFPTVEDVTFYDQTMTTMTADDNTTTVMLTVTYGSFTAMYNQPIECMATFPDFNETRTSQEILDYKIKPLLRSMTGGSVALVETTQTSYECKTTIKPEASNFYWTLDGVAIPSSYMPTVVNNCTMTSDMRYDCSSNLTIHNLTKEDNKRLVSCSIEYEGMNYSTGGISIEAYFPPTMVQINGSTEVFVDNQGSVNISLSCNTDETYPQVGASWRKNDRYVTSMYDVENVYTPGNYSAFTLVSTVQVPVDRTMDGAKISCCVQDVCDEVYLNVSFIPQIIYPVMETFYVYVGYTLDIPCRVDSKPDSVIYWNFMDLGNMTELAHMSTMNDDNSNTLTITNATMNVAGNYTCSAMQTPGTMVRRTVKVVVVEPPVQPTFMVAGGSGAYVDVTYSVPPPTIARMFYIQFKKSSESTWLQVDMMFQDNLPGQNKTSERFTFPEGLLDAGSVYDVRVTSVDVLGLMMHSSSKQITTADAEPTEDMVTYAKYRDAILISVLVTAGGFIIIIIVILCCVKHGRCASSSKSYVM